MYAARSHALGTSPRIPTVGIGAVMPSAAMTDGCGVTE